MGKMLIIAEKPSVARDIAEALGGFKKTEDWLESSSAIISSGIGHLARLVAPEAATSGKDLATLPVIPREFAIEPIPKTQGQLRLLGRLMKRPDVDQVVNACDAGREGELIFRLIYEYAGCRKQMKRMWLQSMTAEAIREAYRNMQPGSKFDALGDAAKCRSEADFLVGINGSRGITYLHAAQTQRYEGMAAGRVQTPTLAMITEREDAIRNFVPQDYWEVHGTFGTAAGTYAGRWFNPAVAAPAKGDDAETEGEEEDAAASGFRINDRAKAEEIAAKCRGVAPSSVKDDAKSTSSAPPKLYDITTLQREANRRFKFASKKTLNIAQALYETHKVTTYPRTGSTALPEDYVEKAKELLGAIRDGELAVHAKRVQDNSWVRGDNKRIFDNSEISDHFAIIPTGKQPAGLDPDEAKIYDMIVRRFIAAFHPAAEYRQTTRITVVAGESFKSSGKVLVSKGWLEVYPELASKGGPGLCVVQPGEAVRNDGINVKTLKTTPPSRYNEDTLLAAMKNAGRTIDDEALRAAMKDCGLGTGATRAEIIEGLLRSKDAAGKPKEPYVIREKTGYMVPTEKAMGLIRFLKNNGIEMLTSPRMTGEWEQKLAEIEKGKQSRSAFMAEIAQMTHGMIRVIRDKAASLPSAQVEPLQVLCPKCKTGQIVQGMRTFDCKAGCGFTLWREVAGRPLSTQEVEQLLRDGATKPLDGFKSRKTKRSFSAALRLDDEFKVAFVFEEREGGNGQASEPGVALAVPCPKCGGTIREKGPKFVCDKGDFTLWREIAQRPLSPDEATALLRNGSLPSMHGFVSGRTGKQFGAGLKLSRDKSKVEFVFGD
ncbi:MULTISPECIES: DNA topoisomerase [Xanthomonas]|uniref:DNA topoisomerase n=3 Tax=Xanthomonas TaxID=338 RepID=A0A7Z7NG36_XANCH|nr:MULTISPECIES: DNA topoisomerase [Xanthomonas]ATS86738.1 topoisomerase C-terminal repeat-containing protein [Xanthomonas citri pv. phaseoli var. fuscans]WOP59106.1 DNA topoisomerase [Xanthomonas euvesicatoria]SOO23684.1 DNA topoisomerase [Xanthomonas phaseoli pv. phaseoli]